MNPDNQNSKQPLTRRAALKALAAITGSVTLAQLPPTWQTPVVEVGVLPAHAQTSQGQPIISNLSETFAGTNNCTLTDGKTGSSSVVTFTYNDPLGKIGPGTILQETATFSPAGTVTTATITTLSISGDGHNGTISRTACTRFEGNSSLILNVVIVSPDGRRSNPATITVTAPPGAQGPAGDGARS